MFDTHNFEHNGLYLCALISPCVHIQLINQISRELTWRQDCPLEANIAILCHAGPQ